MLLIVLAEPNKNFTITIFEIICNDNLLFQLYTFKILKGSAEAKEYRDMGWDGCTALLHTHPPFSYDSLFLENSMRPEKSQPPIVTAYFFAWSLRITSDPVKGVNVHF